MEFPSNLDIFLVFVMTTENKQSDQYCKTHSIFNQNIILDQTMPVIWRSFHKKSSSFFKYFFSNAVDHFGEKF